MKWINRLCALLLLVILFLPIFDKGLRDNDSQEVVFALEHSMISTREQLTAAISSAEQGDVLLVDDLDFGLPDLPLAVTINKSITIKSGKESGRSVFVGGSFFVEGVSEKISVSFEGIDFLGTNENASEFLFENDGYLEEGVYVPPQIKKHIFSALTFKGNVDGSVKNCAFKGYVNACGSAINADNAGNSKHVNLRLERVSFNGNAAREGGAVYIGEGTELNALACGFLSNVATNGGGLYIKKSHSFLDGCIFAENTAKSVGGGIYLSIVESTPVTLLNVSIYQNVADNGGGVGFVPNLGNNGKLNLLFCSYYKNITQNELYSFDLPEQPYANFFGCAVVDDALPEIYNETDEGDEYYTPWERWYPSSENGYNYVALLSQSEEDGLSFTVEKDRLALLGGEFPVLSLDEIPEGFGFAFKNVYGALLIGSNAGDFVVTVKSETETSTQSFDYGNVIALPTPYKTGHSFMNWTTDEGDEIDVERIAFGTKELVLMPVFVPNSYNLTLYYAQGPEQRTVVFGEEIILPTAQKDKYDFIGWFTEENGGGVQFENGDNYLIEGDLTLYAVFKKRIPWGGIIGTISGVTVIAIAIIILVLVWKKKEQKLISQAESALASGNLPDTSSLTAREKEVLELLLKGKKRYEIAQALFVSEETVKKQITSIYRKLGVSSRSELFAKFM